MSLAPQQHQNLVAAHFSAVVENWRAIYQSPTLDGRIHQQRRAIALTWIDELALQPGEHVLEIGCGAGLTAVALARHGHLVVALDSAEAMLEHTRQYSVEMGVESMVIVTQGDAHRLQFQDETFGLVVALGVIPWLHSPLLALQEMARVLRPGGYLVLNCDNYWRLNHLLDPLWNPVIVPFRRLVGKCLRQIGLVQRETRAPLVHLETINQFNGYLSHVGLEKRKGITFGFGPFSLFGHSLFADSVAVSLHSRLQTLADHDVPPFRSMGSQYLVLARKLRCSSSLCHGNS